MTIMKKSQVIEQLTTIIDDLVISNNGPVLDDMYPDLLSDGYLRSEAVDTLMEFIENYREDL